MYVEASDGRLRWMAEWPAGFGPRCFVFIAFFLLISPVGALAGPPEHPRDVSLGLNGFNHACGTAADSEGYVYVASAGESKVRIFDPTHAEVGFIPNGNEPCGLGVDGDGALYVLEKATGDVLRYVPTAYPFVGTPSYGAPTTIDGSGNAKGLAVDPYDGRLYVAKGDRVAVYTSDGNFEADLGVGELSNAVGVAAYSYPYEISKNFEGKILSETVTRYMFVAEGTENEIKIFSGDVFNPTKAPITAPILRRTFGNVDHDENPETAPQEIEFGAQGAYLAVDPGNRSAEETCTAAKQACTSGHFLLYDAAHDAVDEFDAHGEFVDQITDPELAYAEPTGMAIERSGGSGDGTIYVTSGASVGASLLAFEPLVAPRRVSLPVPPKSPTEPPSHVLPSARAVATDSFGNVYVAADAFIKVYNPAGQLLTEIEDAGVGPLEDLAVDHKGRVFVLEKGERVAYYSPIAFPPVNGTTYTRSTPAGATKVDFGKTLLAIAINPGPGASQGQLFVTSLSGPTRRFSSVDTGFTVIDLEFATALCPGVKRSVAVHGRSGNVYFGMFSRRICIVNKDGTMEISRISGVGSPSGLIAANPVVAIVEENGHVITFGTQTGQAREYDVSGAFVAEFGKFTPSTKPPRLAIDNSCALHDPPLTETTSPTCDEFNPSSGNAYVAYDDSAPGTPDLWAFDKLEYSSRPSAVVTDVSEVGAGSATLEGTVNPNGFEVLECEFEYLNDQEFQANGKTFAGAQTAPCVPDPLGIGEGMAPVPVSAQIGGLDTEERYWLRLRAANEFGDNITDERHFGPPVIVAQQPLSIFFDEATLRANIDPSGLETKYHFEYGTQTGVYNQSTPIEVLSAGAGPTNVQVPLSGLLEGAKYFFRVVAENEAKLANGPEQDFTTAQRQTIPPCGNSEYRVGLSAKLPDCRAYELITPAETNGLIPYFVGPDSAGAAFNTQVVTPRGPGAGETVSYFTDGTLSGFDGNGRLDGYQAKRDQSEGDHPLKGWRTEFFGLSFVEVGASTPGARGISPDQNYSFWRSPPVTVFTGTLPEGNYLRTPDASAAPAPCNPVSGQSTFELVGCGSEGTDPAADSRYVSGGGNHVIFSSNEHLEDEAPPEGTTAIYDRPAGELSATVVSLLPGAVAPVGNSSYVASTEDGSRTVFSEDGRLYAYDAEGGQVVGAPNAHAGNTLTCVGGSGGSASLSHAWLRNGSPIGGATSSSYTITVDDESALIQCQVTASSPEGGSIMTSEPLVISPFPSEPPPSAVDNPALSGAAGIGEMLTCDPGDWDGAPSLDVQWYRNGAPIGGADESTYLIAPADEDTALQCGVVATGTQGVVLAFTQALIVRDPAQPPTASVNPSISGTPSVGETLTCNPGTWTNSPSFTYQWLRGGVEIAAATNPTYNVVVADEGMVVQCRVSAANSDATATAMSSGAVIPPAPGTAPPSQSSPGSVSGKAAFDQTLSCTSGVWSGDPDFSYQWLRNGSPVATATDDEYTVVAADRETTLQCQVTATNAGGTTVAINAGTGARYVEPNPPVATASVPDAFTFAGISSDGHLFYTNADEGSQPGQLFVLDLSTGGLTQITASGVFVNVAADEAKAFFTSEDVLTGSETNDAGDVALVDEPNLYAWDGDTVRFIGILADQDFVSFGGIPQMDLGAWTTAINPGTTTGRAFAPTRSTPDGDVFVFQSHAQLTDYDNKGSGEIYRYAPAAPAGERLICLSCNPSNASPSADALLQELGGQSGLLAEVVIPNITDDGAEVFFQSPDALRPEDANDVKDVYKWEASGVSSACDSPGGCLALISSGQGETPSYLYGMSADGRDVFFRTLERLVGADVPGSTSIYDAREGGGIPEPLVNEPCQGDACQGNGTPPPFLSSPASTGDQNDNITEQPVASCPKGRHRVKSRCVARCPKGRHRVKGRCTKKAHKKGRHQGKSRQANPKGGER